MMLDNNDIKPNLKSQTFPITADSQNGCLIIGQCNTVELANKYGTPIYLIDKETFRSKCLEYINSLKKYYQNFEVLYAAKAFACKRIFKIANELNVGLDVVSGGELHTAIHSGFNVNKIYFHGNNKSPKEIELAVKHSINSIICDNFYELENLISLGKKLQKNINIMLRLTPGIECHTHEYIKTGHLDSKFGFDLVELDNVLSIIKKEKNLTLKGYHAHIGSQIFEIAPFLDTVDILLEKFKHTKNKFDIELSELNIGGGIGISYTSKDDPVTIEDWAKAVSKRITEKCNELSLNLPKLICEPGRSLIANSGVTLYKVGAIKQVPEGRKYVSVDGGMADNPRPITYQAEYTAVIANKISEKPAEKVTIAGKYCESGDILIKDISLPKVDSGDIIAVLSTGAYNYSMSSNYNLSPRPACILVNEGHSEVIIESENYDDLIKKHK